MKNIRLKPGLTKLVFIFPIILFLYLRKIVLLPTRYDFSLWLRNGSKPTNIKWFRGHTGKRKPTYFLAVAF